MNHEHKVNEEIDLRKIIPLCVQVALNLIQVPSPTAEKISSEIDKYLSNQPQPIPVVALQLETTSPGELTIESKLKRRLEQKKILDN